MKIEKVNDHQIRCTLTKSDLADRQMKISELAYGTDKAKNLFRDMMQQAAYEFGFEAEDIPLMIEAIPLSGDCIVLIITKVEDPDELDTRFSGFAGAADADGEDEGPEDAATGKSTASFNVTADDVIDLFKKLRTELAQTADRLASAGALSGKSAEVTVVEDVRRLYYFRELDHVIALSGILKGLYSGENHLYRCRDQEGFILVVHQTSHTPEDYNRICNIISEYGQAIIYTKGQDAYYREHGDAFIREDALQKLSRMFDRDQEN